MTRMLMLTALTTLLATMPAITGCEHNQQQDLAQVPPPDYENGEPTPMPAPQYAHAQAQPQAQADAQQPIDPEPMPAAQAQVQAQPQAQGADTYTVREGDTLWSIAESVYNDGHKWEEIVSANPGLSPDELRVGQEIVLP